MASRGAPPMLPPGCQEMLTEKEEAENRAQPRGARAPSLLDPPLFELGAPSLLKSTLPKWLHLSLAWIFTGPSSPRHVDDQCPRGWRWSFACWARQMWES